ncbi:ribonuclease Oy [Thrips palmi]|uniref:Ribonuclease Oy n=1 Tax=Thrips palmi TaxID=161013 RepID=A0A6P8ZA76_THRPL|nr:ribonuclease Oy [Thrips palmi]XP_034247467.1 ribonuclease Oy [Thrips palmi]XP_034247476.1 ribonuclease Oy [Thrips palmi]
MMGATNIGALCVLVIVSLSSAEAAGIPSKDWDYIIFTQHWPATVCLQWKAEGTGHSCALPKASMWTVHGVWPTKNNTKGPMFCNKSLPFDEEALAPIASDLQNYWINIDMPTPPYSFWRHEWEKHGTCAAALPALHKEIDYFSQGLDWLKKFNMYTALQNQGIHEGNAYMVKNIREAVRVQFGKLPTVHCYKDSNTGKSYLFEIRLCFDKSLKNINCPKACSTNCPNVPIEYPTLSDLNKRVEVKRKWLLDLLRIVRWIQWITY